MATPSNPIDIAREAFRQLATRRTPPTPDNYRVVYAEVSGQPLLDLGLAEKQLRSLATELPKVTPEQLRLGRELDEASKQGDWGKCRKLITDHVASLTDTAQLGWSDLINDLIRQWETKSGPLTPAKKRESLEHVLGSSSGNPNTLFTRLQNLVRNWSQNATDAEVPLVEDIQAGDNEVPVKPTPPASPTKPSDLLPEIRELFAFTLETGIAAMLIDHPTLAQEVGDLAGQIRRAHTVASIQEAQAKLKRLAFKLELIAEDQIELRASLLKLLRLVVENISELVLDDKWLHGQMELVREIVEKPLSQRAVDDAEQRLKEVIFKQSQLKYSLHEAREALKNMLAGFVDHLADFAGATSDYHDKIEKCAEKISAANDIAELENVLTEVMQETRTIQINALRSKEELQQTQQRARQAEERILALEKELAETSSLVRYDQLTGALNRRGLEEMFQKEIARSQRHETPLCVGLLDIDNFKRLNDSQGHDAGDAALIHLSLVIRETLRPQDTVARFGGEEFIVLFPDSDIEQAVTAMTRVQRELTRRIFLHDNQKVLITFSAGVVQMRFDDTQATAIKRADEAMYKAKQTGKNKVVAA